jgi:hypothetical protein
MFLKNISFGPPFEISIKFRKKSLKNIILVEKKNLRKNFEEFAKNYPLNPMSLPPHPRFFKFSELAPPRHEVVWESLTIMDLILLITKFSKI